MPKRQGSGTWAHPRPPASPAVAPRVARSPGAPRFGVDRARCQTEGTCDAPIYPLSVRYQARTAQKETGEPGEPVSRREAGPRLGSLHPSALDEATGASRIASCQREEGNSLHPPGITDSLIPLQVD